jgi:glutathione S-transferase
VAEAARARVRQTLYSHGLGRHREEEIVELGNRSIAALSALLDDKPYLFGDMPCGADATAFAFAAGVLTPFFDSKLRKHAESHSNLPAYCERMMRRYYSEFLKKAA